MGPNQDGTPREAIVERMLALLEGAVRDGVELIVYPEMALTTYFPKRIRQDFDQFFETEVPPKALEPLLRRAAAARVAVHVGFCEKADGKYFNTALLTDRDGRLCGTFRKIHLPATKIPDGFAPGARALLLRPRRHRLSRVRHRRHEGRHRDLSGPAVPRELSRARAPGRRDHPDRLQHAALAAGARPERALHARRRYANLCFVVGVAKAGVEDGVELIAGSCIIDRRASAGAGRHARRRARRRAHRPRADGAPAQALELPRAAPAAALRTAAPAGDDKEPNR